MTPRSPTKDAVHAAWPAERFYWAVLEAPAVRRAWLGGSTDGPLLALLEEWIPEPIDAVHAAFAPLDDRRVLACAAPRAALADATAVTLTPAGLPAELGALGVDPASLNLLTGPFEPPAVRRARRGRAAVVWLAMICLPLLVAWGLERRAAAHDRGGGAARAAAAGVLATLFPDAPDADPLRLEVELERQRRLRPDPGLLERHADAGVELARLLDAFPRGAAARVELLSVSPSAMSLTAHAAGDTGALARALTAPPGWTLDEPSLEAAGERTRLRARFRRSAAAEGAAP